MTALRRPCCRAVIIAAVSVLVGAGVASCTTDDDAPASEKSSVAITAADGGMLERHGLATVRIPPDGVSGDAVLRVTEGEGADPDPGTGFVPAGSPVDIAVDGASLTAPATVQLSLEAPADADEGQPFAPVAMYLDEAAGAWVPVESTYDADKGAVVAETTHLSTWRAFAWDWQADGDATAALVAGAFGDGDATQAAPPVCPRQQEAEAIARAAVTPPGHLPSCLDLDASGGLLLRVVNDRPFAIQVQQLDGTELAERQQQPPSSTYGAPVIANWLAVATHFRLAVLGPGEGATFQVTSLASPTGISATTTTLSYVTDVLDIGIGELSWMLGTLGSPAAGDKGALYGTLFASGDLTTCASAGIEEKPGEATAGTSSSIAETISNVVFGCLGDEASAHLPADLPTPALAEQLVNPGLGVVADELLEGRYLDNLLSGAQSVSVQVTAA